MPGWSGAVTSPGFITDRHEHVAGVDRAAVSADGTHGAGNDSKLMVVCNA